jgi:hypothetical protein
MAADEHERSWDSAVAALPQAGWLGPMGRAWWLGAEPERRPPTGDGSTREPDRAAGAQRARAVRTVFDDVVRCRPSEASPRRSF